MVELLVSMLIIGILTALIIPSFTKTRSVANASAVISTAQAYQTAIEQFQHDHGGRVPVPTSSSTCTTAGATADWETCGGNAQWGPRDSLARANGQSGSTSFHIGSYIREIPELITSGKVGICFRLHYLNPIPGQTPSCATTKVNSWFVYEPFEAPGTQVNSTYSLHIFARAKTNDVPSYTCSLGALHVSNPANVTLDKLPAVPAPKACTQ